MRQNYKVGDEVAFKTYILQSDGTVELETCYGTIIEYNPKGYEKQRRYKVEGLYGQIDYVSEYQIKIAGA